MVFVMTSLSGTGAQYINCDQIEAIIYYYYKRGSANLKSGKFELLSGKIQL